MAQTAEEYHINEDNWGGYQYITMKSIIDELLDETNDTASHLSNVSRTKLLMACKNGIRTLNREVKKTIHAIEVTIKPTLSFELPQDYVDWVRVSVVTPDFRLMPLDVNNNINTAIGYLQDHNAEVLFDQDGGILKADSSNAYAHPHKKYPICHSFRGRQQSLDTSKLSMNGEFKVDEQRGTMVFSSDLDDKEIVIEYISDGLANENLSEIEIRIHKNLKDALLTYVYYTCIKTRKATTVGQNEKRRANLERKTELHNAKVLALNLDFNQISRVARTSTKQ